MATLHLPAAAQSQRRPHPRRVLGRSIVYSILLLGTAVTLVPFLWVLLTSLKPASEIVKVPPSFFPERWTFQSYQTIFSDPRVPLARFYLNSLFVAGSRVLITLFTSSLAGYIFARYTFAGKSVAFAFILAQLMIPFQVVMIPAYLILVQLHLVDTLWGLIIPSMVDAFGIFMLSAFLKAIPRDLEEAALIDGASYFQIYKDVILPLARPALLTLFIIQFQGMWNDFLNPLLYLNTPDMWVMNVALSVFQQQYKAQWNLTLVGAMINAFVPLTMFFFFSKYYIEGVSYAGVKG